MDIPSVITLKFSTSHAPDYPFECDTCKLNFANEADIQLHKNLSDNMLEINDTALFELRCNHCSRYFTTFKGLKQHIGKIHDKVKKFDCKYCPKKFKNPYAAKNHRMQVHYKKNIVECHLCGSSLYNKFALLKHLKACKGCPLENITEE